MHPVRSALPAASNHNFCAGEEGAGRSCVFLPVIRPKDKIENPVNGALIPTTFQEGLQRGTYQAGCEYSAEHT